MWFHDSVLPQRLNGRLFRLFLVLAAALFALGAFRPVMDNVDLGWHVAQGRWMAEHGTVYRHDVLNYLTLGQPIVNEYPLFEVVLYLFWKWGWWGPCLLTAIGYLALIFILGRAAFRLGLDGSASFLFALGAMIFYLELVYPLRPHLVTYLGLAATGVFLLRHRDAGRWTEFWPLALWQIAWTNCHGGFVLGPIMTACFGLEMTLRAAFRQRAWPWATARTWAGAFLLLLLVCCVNAAGPAVFYPPFYQAGLEAIRAYVDEMEPIGSAALLLIYLGVTGLAAAAVIVTAWRRRDISWSFVILAALLLAESFSARKSWPVFGMFLPLLVLSSGALGRKPAQRGVLLQLAGLVASFSLTALVAMVTVGRINPAWPSSIASTWGECDAGRSELSLRAVAWMRAQGLEGRLFHRGEDGGWLQEAGYDHGETFGDTGYGKYDEATIRLIAMAGERPVLLPRFIAAYQPAYIVCDNFTYTWPHYLQQAGWRLIFYSPYSAVWTQAGNRPDLPTVTPAQIEAAFDGDLAAHGLPLGMTMYGRAILELNSLGLEDFAFARLTGLPKNFHHTSWYWEGARIMCFDTPMFSPAHRGALFAEAQALHDDTLTADFRAHVLDAAGDADGARKILAPLSTGPLGSPAGDLLLRIELDQNRPEALALAENRDGFDLRDGWHWALLARAEEQAGHGAAALAAWKKAVFYYPDEPGLIGEAASFATRHHADDLQNAIDAGVPMPLPSSAPDPAIR
jgi:hypothetical protein